VFPLHHELICCRCAGHTLNNLVGEFCFDGPYMHSIQDALDRKLEELLPTPDADLEPDPDPGPKPASSDEGSSADPGHGSSSIGNI
jgi:hypothetical protein